MALPGFQKKFLRAKAHHLRPVVQVGDGGMGPGVMGAIDQALRDHELVKVRLLSPEDKKSAAAALASASGAELCGLVGHTVILYRRHPELPKIVLPQRAGAP